MIENCYTEKSCHLKSRNISVICTKFCGPNDMAMCCDVYVNYTKCGFSL